MPAPRADDPRWSLEFAGGALMDLGCYGLHVMRRFGAAAVVRATARLHTGVDESCDVELEFPSGATGLSANSMVARRFVHPAGHRYKGDAMVHNFVKPQEDDRITITTPAGQPLGTPRPPRVLHLSAGGVRRSCPARRPLPLDTADAVANMALIDDAYRAAGMKPRALLRQRSLPVENSPECRLVRNVRAEGL